MIPDTLGRARRRALLLAAVLASAAVMAVSGAFTAGRSATTAGEGGESAEGSRAGDSSQSGLAQQAWEEVRFLNFAKAAELFDELRAGQPRGSAAWRQAALGLAVCLHYAQPDVEADKVRAGGLYDELLSGPRDERIRPLALLLRGRLADQVDFYGDTPDAGTAERLYAQLMREHPAHPLAHEAALYLAQIRIFSGDEKTATRGIEELQAWAGAHPGNPCESLQWLAVAGAWSHPFSDPARAVSAMQKAEKAGLPAMMKRDGFYWQLAGLARKAGDSSTALRYYGRIIVEQPRSAYCYEAQRRIVELGGTPPPLLDPFDEKPPATAGKEARP